VLDAGAVVVFGEDALTELDPSQAWQALGRRRRVVLIDAAEADVAAVACWVRGEFTEVVPAGGLREAVEAAFARLSRARGAARWPMQPHAWWPTAPAPGSRGERALHAVAGLAHPGRVGDWHAALSWTYRELHAACRHDLGARPREVLDAYVVAQAEAGQAQGWTEEELAHLLGYAYASGISRVLGRVRRRRARAAARGGDEAS
jgi:hypothetical protein